MEHVAIVDDMEEPEEDEDDVSADGQADDSDAEADKAGNVDDEADEYVPTTIFTKPQARPLF